MLSLFSNLIVPLALFGAVITLLMYEPKTFFPHQRLQSMCKMRVQEPRYISAFKSVIACQSEA